MQAEITQIPIPNAAARAFVGPQAGRTNMDLKVRLIDAATGKVEREQMIRSANNIWLSAATMGVRNENFARETGALLADYVLTVCGKRTRRPDSFSSPFAHCIPRQTNP